MARFGVATIFVVRAGLWLQVGASMLAVSLTERLEETFMKIEGACHCGYITYVAEIDPDKSGYAIVRIAKP